MTLTISDIRPGDQIQIAGMSFEVETAKPYKVSTTNKVKMKCRSISNSQVVAYLNLASDTPIEFTEKGNT